MCIYIYILRIRSDPHGEDPRLGVGSEQALVFKGQASPRRGSPKKRLGIDR